jgi:hypothetical protein
MSGKIAVSIVGPVYKGAHAVADFILQTKEVLRQRREVFEIILVDDGCPRHGIAVIEDNAHGLFGKYKGRSLGTFGQMAAQSFHETKNITCGEGGPIGQQPTFRRACGNHP